MRLTKNTWKAMIFERMLNIKCDGLRCGLRDRPRRAGFAASRVYTSSVRSEKGSD